MAEDGSALVGSRDALYLRAGPSGDARRLPWEEVEAADWDHDSRLLRVTEVGRWGERRPVHRVVLDEPGRLLELVRERVSTSVLLHRHVAVSGRRGVRVIARRAPRGDQPISWFFEYDEGVDPDDPVVRLAAEDALETARRDLGEL
ncbi:MAG: hypothetical protein R2731_16315 [Nocardioides sp.]